MQCFGSVRALALGLFAAAAVGAVGCGGEADDVESVQSAITTENALTANALTANALTANALTANALTANALRDPLARELLKYVVSCALEEDDELAVRIDGKRYVFPGSRGLARESGRDRGDLKATKYARHVWYRKSELDRFLAVKTET